MLKYCLTVAVALLPLCASEFAFAEEPAIAASACFTYGNLGPKRQNVFLPDETLFISVKCTGIAVTEKRIAKYNWQLTLINSKNEEIASNISNDSSVHLIPGGNSTKFSAGFRLPSGVMDGAFRIKLVVNDVISQKSATLDLPFTVQALGSFGASDIRFNRDVEGSQKAGACFNLGESAYLKMFICELQAENEKWKLTSSVKIYDSNKRLIKDAIKLSTSSEIDPLASGLLPLSVGLQFNQSGKFYAVFEIEDLVSKKKDTHTLPFVVVDALELE